MILTWDYDWLFGNQIRSSTMDTHRLRESWEPDPKETLMFIDIWNFKVLWPNGSVSVQKQVCLD